MKIESKQQELIFMYILWELLMHLQKHLKVIGELEFMHVRRECKWRCLHKIDRLSNTILCF